MYLLWRRSMIGFTACKVNELPTDTNGRLLDYADKYTLKEEEERLPIYKLEVMYPCRVSFEEEETNTS